MGLLETTKWVGDVISSNFGVSSRGQEVSLSRINKTTIYLVSVQPKTSSKSVTLQSLQTTPGTPFLKNEKYYLVYPSLTYRRWSSIMSQNSTILDTVGRTLVLPYQRSPFRLTNFYRPSFMPSTVSVGQSSKERETPLFKTNCNFDRLNPTMNVGFRKCDYG